MNGLEMKLAKFIQTTKVYRWNRDDVSAMISLREANSYNTHTEKSEPIDSNNTK